MSVFEKGHKDSKSLIDKNNSKLFQDDLIVCNEDRNIIEIMKKGYQEMAKINLQLAIDNECELMDLKEYETWLCGV
jgi:hypothetical protein